MWVDSENVTDENAAHIFNEAQGILIPGGFGDRGVEGDVYKRQGRGYSNDELYELTKIDRFFLQKFRNIVEGKVRSGKPVYRMVDTCAGEFEAETPYFYAVRDGEMCIRDRMACALKAMPSARRRKRPAKSCLQPL